MKHETNGSPAISVIVPIYNAEKTIRKCVDSLLAQTFEDFEVLLIDDGSPDQCGAICDEYAQQDSRVRVIHQENQGVSAARQCGMDNAQGEYTIHADPDDWVEPNMLEELYKKAKEDDADMVICDYFEDGILSSRYVKQKLKSLYHLDVLYQLFEDLHGSCWNKLIRRKFFSTYNVSFPNGISYCEDQYVIVSLLKHPLKVAYLESAYYHYVNTNFQSLSRKYSKNSYEEDLVILEIFSELLNGTEIYEKGRNTKVSSLVSRAFYYGREIFDSATFKSLFFPYRMVFIKAKVGHLYERPLFFFSCIGFYKSMFFIFESLHKLKNLFSK